VQTMKGSLHGVIRKVRADGRIVWRPDGQSAELIALPESLLKEERRFAVYSKSRLNVR
jgi:hypothetical protein